MTDPVPAPEEQGDARKCGACGHWAHGTEECMAFMRSGSNPPITSCRCTNSEEQQGEPVCARCGHPEFASDGSAVHISERDLDGGDDSDDWCIGCANEKRPIWGHPFEPAPPPSEEAEVHKGHECSAWCVFQSWVSEIRGGEPNTDDLGLRSAYDAIAAEARRPIEEERDRLRERLHVRDLRYEAAERGRESAQWRAMRAEAGEIRARDVAAVLGRARWTERKAKRAAEAQVQELRAALEEALADIKDGWKDSAATVIRRALAAH